MWISGTFRRNPCPLPPCNGVGELCQGHAEGHADEMGDSVIFYQLVLDQTDEGLFRVRIQQPWVTWNMEITLGQLWRLPYPGRWCDCWSVWRRNGVHPSRWLLEVVLCFWHHPGAAHSEVWGEWREWCSHLSFGVNMSDEIKLFAIVSIWFCHSLR